ncbi:MAG: DinB family protein, partial [Chloroflexota bacterium]
ERAQLTAMIANLNDENAQRVVHGDWRVQDVLAHIASGERGSLTYAKMVVAQKPMGTPSDGQPFDLDRWNQAQVERRRGKSLAEVVAELRENRKATLTFVAEQSAEMLARRGSHPIFGDATLADVIRSIAEADRHHLQEIKNTLAR